MRVFAEVAQDTRRTIIEYRAHQIEERTGKNPFPNGQGLPPTRQARESGELLEATWDPEGSERTMEAERQRQMGDDLGRIKDDSGFANGQSTSTSTPSAAVGTQEIKKATKGTWDKIRQGAFGSKETASESGAPSVRRGSAGVEDTRSKEQREFDEMLEKERQGGVGEDKWA
jgi:hypothetical protein